MYMYMYLLCTTGTCTCNVGSIILWGTEEEMKKQRELQNILHQEVSVCVCGLDMNSIG